MVSRVTYFPGREFSDWHWLVLSWLHNPSHAKTDGFYIWLHANMWLHNYYEKITITTVEC